MYVRETFTTLETYETISGGRQWEECEICGFEKQQQKTCGEVLKKDYVNL